MMNLGIAAVVLAAGRSQRMGRPKMTLPWGETTVIGQVVQTLAQGGVEDIVVVTGGAQDEVEQALAALPPEVPRRSVLNRDHAQTEMAHSLAVGLSALRPEASAALVALGDQPQIEAETVQALVEAYRQTGKALIVPSYRMRRGHPWLLGRPLWAAVAALPDGATLRDLLNAHAAEIHYLPLDAPTVLLDLDTPADYQRHKPADPD
jgi:molybdenum cofactor cytidylyltransferase